MNKSERIRRMISFAFVSYMVLLYDFHIAKSKYDIFFYKHYLIINLNLILYEKKM